MIHDRRHPDIFQKRLLGIISIEHAVIAGTVLGAIWLMLGKIEKTMEVNDAITGRRLFYLETAVNKLDEKVDELRVRR